MNTAKFIITTFDSHGQPNAEKSTNLSTINSHVASHKARNCGHKWQPPIDHTATSGLSRAPSRAEASRSASERVNGSIPFATDGELCAWTFEELDDIFGGSDQPDLHAGADNPALPDPQARNPQQSVGIVEETVNPSFSAGSNLGLGYDFEPADPLSVPHNHRRVRNVYLQQHHHAYRSDRKPNVVNTTSANSRALSHTRYNTQQISTTLDPFFKLPVEVSTRERSLLHFFLTEGRKALYGAMSDSTYCPAMHAITRGAMSRSPAYTHSHIAIAEYLLCHMRAAEVSPIFFRRRAQAYKTVNELIQKNATFDDQVCGLVTMQHAEYAVGRPDLQCLHLTALDQLVTRNGGTQAFLKQRAGKRAMVVPVFYSVQFTFTEFQTQRSLVSPETMVESLVSALQRISSWSSSGTMSNNTIRGKEPADKRQPSIPMETLYSLTNYLGAILSNHLRVEGACHKQSASTFYLVLTICLTFTEFTMSSSQAMSFLTSFQQLFQQVTNTDYDMRISVAICLVSQLRTQKQPYSIQQGFPYDYTSLDNLEEEVSICDICINAMKLFPLISFALRLRLGTKLLGVIARLIEHENSDKLTEQDFEDLNTEIINAGRQEPP